MASDVSSSGQTAGQQEPARPAVPEAPLALYRRYRPATFAELKGQDHVTEPLRQALRSGRVNHAYLFSGPRGCGKTSSARILARSLNCEEGPTPDPCGKCASCIALAPSGPGSIDVIEIDAASHGGIDDARDLRERAFYSPVAGRYKIYIIDEAHMVTGAGFNALLKLVEEPPPHLKFVFATTEPEKVIPTIRSRTHHYPFRLVPPAILRELLEEILAAEKITYEPGVLPVVIRAGAGSVRDSLSVLDQLIAGADDSGLRYDRAIALLGYTDDALLDETAEAFSARDGAAVFRAIDHVVEAGHDPRRFALDLLDRLRDLIVLAAVPDAAASGLLDAPEDALERMRGQAAGFGQERLVRAAETISAGLVEMRGATSPRLLLELMCAQVLLPAAGQDGADHNDLVARLEQLERQVAGAGYQAGPGQPRSAAASTVTAAPARMEPGVTGRGSAPVPARPAGDTGPGHQAGRSAAPAPPPAQHQQGSAGLDAASIVGRWPEVLDAVREVRKTAWILLSNYATLESVEDNVLTLAFDTEGNAKGFGSSGSDHVLAELLGSMFGARVVIRTIVQPARRAAAAEGRGGRDGGSGRTGVRDGRTPHDGTRDGGSPDSAAPASGTAASGTGNTAARPHGPGSGGGRPGSGGSRPGTAGAGQRTGRSGAQSAAGQHSEAGPSKERSTGSDDPRPLTDAMPAAPGDDLTGTDLIMRELGGRVVEEIGEA